MRGSRFRVPAPARFTERRDGRGGSPPSWQPAAGSALAGGPRPGCEAGGYHDVSTAMGEASVTISTSSGPSLANARHAATSA